MELQLSHSLRSAYRSCTRKVYYKYIAGIKPKKDTTPRVIGRSFHEALNVWRQGKELSHAIAVAHEKLADGLTAIGIDKSKIEDKCHEMTAYLAGYEKRFGDESLLGYQSEQQFIYMNEIAYVDAMFFEGDKIYFVEDKTTSSFAEEREASLRFNDQLLSYTTMLQRNGYKVGGCIYRETLKTRTKRNKKETGLDYSKRVMEIYLEDVENKYREYRLSFSREELSEHISGIFLLNNSIRDHLKMPKEPRYWPRNSDNCIGVYGKCDYFEACKGCIDPFEHYECRDKEPLDDGKFQKKFFK